MYNYQQLFKSLIKVGIKKGDVIYFSANLLKLGKYENQRKILDDYYKALWDLVGKKGTIAYPTFNFSIINNKKIFCPRKTSSEMGVLTEFFRKKKYSYRSNHPYTSISSEGYHSKYICTKNSQHSYGPNSPFDRLIILNAKFLSIGIKPNFNSSQVHHAEHMSSVPYRYFKKFNHRVKIGKKIKKKQYFMHVLFENLIGTKRDKNRNIFNHFTKNNKITRSRCGDGTLYLYSIKKFYEANIELFNKDIYAWLSIKQKKIFEKK